MMLRSCVAGDRGDRRFIRLGGVDSLSSVESVEAHVWRHGVDPVALTASVHDAEECVIVVDLGVAEDDWLPSRPRGGHLERSVSAGVSGGPVDVAW